MKILLGADFHLGARQRYLGASAAARQEDLARAFARFVEFALRPDNDVDLVLLLGDLFDHHAPPAPLVEQAGAQIERLLARLPVAAIPGTHDGYGYADSVYRSGRLPGGLVLITSPGLSRTRLDIRGTVVNLYGLAYDPARTAAAPLEGLKRDPEAEEGIHVAMIHGSLPAGPEWEQRRRDIPIPTAELAASGFHLVALGHYHNFVEKRFGRTVAVYPGTLEGLKYSESGERAFVTASVTSEEVRIERWPYPGRQILDEVIDVDHLGPLSSGLEEKIRSLAGTDRIVRLRLTGTLSAELDTQRLLARLADQFFHLAIEDQTLRVDPAWADRLASEPTIRGLFVRKLRQRIDAAGEADRPRLEQALRLGLAEFGALEAVDAT